MNGHIEKRGENIWRVKVHPRKVGGKQRYLTRAVHGSKRDAQAALNEMMREARRESQ